MIRNLEEMRTLEQPLRELGAQHVGWGAKPEDYVLVREALIRAIRGSSAEWNDTVEGDWRRAITAIAVPMLEGRGRAHGDGCRAAVRGIAGCQPTLGTKRPVRSMYWR